MAVLVAVFGGYRGRSAPRFIIISFLDHIAVTVLAVALSFLISLPSLSAYSLKLTQHCVSLSSISATKQILAVVLKDVAIRKDKRLTKGGK